MATSRRPTFITYLVNRVVPAIRAMYGTMKAYIYMDNAPSHVGMGASAVNIKGMGREAILTFLQ